MRQGFALARSARRVGVVVCAVLAVVEAGWLIEDIGLVGADGLGQVWAGLAVPVGGGPLNTSVIDLALIGLYAGAIGAALRPVAAGALAVAGVVTLLWRLPALLILGGQWNGELDVRGQLVLTATVEVLGAVVLLVVVAKGRRVLPGWDPAPPRPAAGVLAGLLLLIVALMTGGWQFYRMGLGDAAQPPGFFWRTVTGGYLVNSLLGTPFGWLTWSMAALCAAAGLAALTRTPLARPVGIATGWLLVPLAVPVIAPAEPTAVTLGQFGAGFTMVAAVVVALLLLPRAEGPFGDPYPYEAADDAAPLAAAQETLTMPAYADWSTPPPPPGPPPPGAPRPGAAGYLRTPPR